MPAFSPLLKIAALWLKIIPSEDFQEADINPFPGYEPSEGLCLPILKSEFPYNLLPASTSLSAGYLIQSISDIGKNQASFTAFSLGEI